MDDRVTTRDLGIIDDEVCFTSDHQSVLDGNSAAGERTISRHQEDGHDRPPSQAK
jgi:hypothetical protein